MFCYYKKTCGCILLGLLLAVSLVFSSISLFSPITFGGVQTQLNNAGGEILANDGTVLFNTVLNDVSSNISYNPLTGQFTITKPGNYVVSWWVDTDGSGGPTPNISFATEVNGAPYSTSSYPLQTGQLNGYDLVTVTTTPTVISLVNVTGSGVLIPSTPVQANMVITEVIK